jgi:hypothetical protein
MGSDVPSEPRPPRQTRRRRGKARAIDPYEPDQGGASAIPSAPVLVLVSLIPQNQRVRVPIPGVGRMVQRRRVAHRHGKPRSRTAGGLSHAR